MLSELDAFSATSTSATERPQESSYADTVKIDQDWEQIKKIMPIEFWDDAIPLNTSLSGLWFRQLVKLKYWVTGQMIHLPHVLVADGAPNTRSAGQPAAMRAGRS